MSRRVLFIRLARWKWNHKIKMTGFVSDVVTFWKIINSWTICWNLFQQIFFPKNEKIETRENRKNEHLYFHSKVQTKSEITEWWVLSCKRVSKAPPRNNQRG